jgi:bifunctional non-homologous end joining protein LigD
VTPTRDLESYRKKRDPERTPEPFGQEASRLQPLPRSGPAARFVVQKHWARNMHYDFRLELDGTLKSWAVPKGPSTRVEEKRLAVHVEDHPLEYANFEGVIPAGNYGAGSVIVWDRGGYGSFKSDDILDQYERGKLELELFGFKLRGRWTLVRMGKKEKEWLLLKKADGAATEREAIERYPESVITGLTVEEMRDVEGTLARRREAIQALAAPQRDVSPKSVSFMLATLADKPPAGDDWCFEVKYDGVRVLASRDGDEVRLYGRSGEDITARYPEIRGALLALPSPRFLIDGEIVAETEEGRPSFQRLQARMLLTKPRDIEAARMRVPVRAMFFDCLAAEGFDLRGVSLVDRKRILVGIIPTLGDVQRVDHIVGHGEAFLEAANAMHLEGIVGKRLASAYSGRRSNDWVKVKCQRRQEFVIGGYTDPQGSRARFGALHVGLYEGTQLVYVTKVGTGFDDATLDAVWKKLEPLQRATSPFAVRSPKDKGNHWAEPKLVCEVRYTEWTRDGGLRHPTFLGLRTDKKPEDCRREEPVAIDASAPAAPDEPAGDGKSTASPRAGAAASKAASDAAAAPHEVKVTNPKKIFWPAESYTKSDLVDYYTAVGPLMLPYLRDRPAVLTRYPDGIEGKSFFQKDAPVFVPDWIRTEPIYSRDTERDIRYFVLDDVQSLRYVANLGTIPIHAWSARVDTLGTPDWCVIDLDPKEASFANVVKVAREVHTILDELELPNHIKTSGASGLHVLIPMGRRYTHEQVRTFARLLAMLVVEALPDISTVTRAIGGRDGKVYVDFGQNGHGNTIVAPFSVRPLPAAPASCPLRWDEVNGKLDPKRFTIKTIPKRFEKLADPLDGVLGDGIDMAEALAAIAERMGKKKAEGG